MSPRITFDEVISQQDIINNKSSRNKSRLSFASNITNNSLKPTSEDFCDNLINHRATRNKPKILHRRSIRNLRDQSYSIGEKKTSLSKKSETTSKISYLIMCYTFLKTKELNPSSPGLLLSSIPLRACSTSSIDTV